MDNKEFSKQLEKRTLDFTISLLRFSAKLPKTIEYNVIRYQLSKSGSSVGANYREANRSRSRKDFINKIKICESESSETVFWLEVVHELGAADSEQCLLMLKEAKELLAIFSSIVSTLNFGKLSGQDY